MKENLIIRKRHLLVMTALFVMLGVNGCAPQVTTQTYTHEAGTELSTDVSEYAVFKKAEQVEAAIVDFSKIDVEKVGTYDAAIILNDREYPFVIEVVDTTAPTETIKEHFVATNREIQIKDFVEGSADYSDFTEGIRNVQLMYNEEQVRELMKKAVGEQNISEMQFDVDKIFQTNWSDDETHFWEEKNVSAEGLEQVVALEADGVYSMEVVAVDVYGNAGVAKVYAMVDTKAPVFTQVDDMEVVASGSFDKYLEAQEEGLVAEDNLMGDMTTAVYVENMEVDGTSDITMTVTYAVNDFAGNTASATRKITITSEKAKAMGSIYGPKLTQVELNEVDAAVQSFLNNYITPGMSDYQKVRAANDFLCNTVTYADSWAYHGANTAWGALVYHEAQCSGYARAMKALCDGMGVGCYYIHSSTTSHQWNEVCVDGNWYIIDVTANDTGWRDAVFLASETSFINFWNGQGYSEDWNRSSVPTCPNDY